VNLLHGIRLFVRRVFSSAQPPSPPRQELGRRGEDEALRYLTARGYRILERNFRWTGGEIDLVAFKEGVISFVEVRARTEPVQLDPLLTVTPLKQQRLVRTANRYIATHNLDRQDVAFRFDVLTVRCPPGGAPAEVEHIEDAF
jgi:putative endonuclease